MWHTYVPLLWCEKTSLQSLPERASLLATTLRIPSNTVSGTTYCHRAGLELPNVVSVVTWSNMFREEERRGEGKERREGREGKKKSEVGERGKVKSERGGKQRNGS